MPIDYSKYPPDWKTRIRPDILKRADDKCEMCGVRNGEMVERDGGRMVKVVLTIAHLDHDIRNNDYANLKALCQKCHLTLDKHQHAENARQTMARRKREREVNSGQMEFEEF